MADLSLTCAACEKTFEVSEYLQAETLPCPGCGKDVEVVRPGRAGTSPPEDPPRKALRRKPKGEPPPTSSGRLALKPKCPVCGKNMSTEDVLCVKCGYDRRSGSMVGQKATRGRLPVFVVLVVLAALLAAGAKFMGLI